MTIETEDVVELLARLRLIRGHTYLADAEAMCDEAADFIQSLSDRIAVLEGERVQFKKALRVAEERFHDTASIVPARHKDALIRWSRDCNDALNGRASLIKEGK